MPVPPCLQPALPERLPDGSRPRQRRSACSTSEPSPLLTATSHTLNLCEELIKNIGIHNAARGPYAALADGALLSMYFSATSL